MSIKKTRKIHKQYNNLLNFNPIEKLVNKYKNTKTKKSVSLNNMIYNNNYKHLFFYGDTILDDVKPIIDELLSFKVSKKSKGIVLHIHSGGGDGNAGFTLYNVCKNVKYPLYFYTEGQSGSASTYTSYCFKNNRIIAPYTVSFIHQYMDSETGQADELYFKRTILQRLEDNICSLYGQYTNLSFEESKKFIIHDLMMLSNHCKELGFVDSIMDIPKKTTKYKEEKQLYILSASQWEDYKDSKESVSDIYDCIFNNITPILNVGDFNKGLEGTKELTMILPLINVCATSPVQIKTVINAPINESSVLFVVCCSYRRMSRDSFCMINFTNLKGEDWQPKMQARLIYYKSYSELIASIFERFTKLPEKMINNIMTERLLLSPEDCLKYGLVDELF
jgi:ATP-dependent protease ClpP protease subunit